jgi:hypothetical protein
MSSSFLFTVCGDDDDDFCKPSFAIREKTQPGEFRYLRLRLRPAWKKRGAAGVMIEPPANGQWPDAKVAKGVTESGSPIVTRIVYQGDLASKRDEVQPGIPTVLGSLDRAGFA